MHVHFVGEPDDGVTVSSHHSRALAKTGVAVSFDDGAASAKSERSRPDVIHLVTHEQSSNAILRQLVSARISGIPIVRYWTGRDVQWATYHEMSREFARAMSRIGALQLCRSKDLEKRLAAIGVSCKALPVISPNLSSVAPPQGLPKTFTVLTYLPQSRREFHGGTLIDSLVHRLASVRFLILGGGGASLADQPNVEWLHDNSDCVRAIQRATVVVDARMDGGLSRFMLEALCHGRHVIAQHELPHVHRAQSLDDFKEAIRSVRAAAEYNLEGRSFVGREHEQHEAVKALRRELEDAVQPGRLNLVLEGGFRGAATTLQNLHLLSARNFPLPTPDQLPKEATALRCLLHDMRQAEQAVAV